MNRGEGRPHVFLRKKKIPNFEKAALASHKSRKGLIKLHFLLKHLQDKIGAPYKMHDQVARFYTFLKGVGRDG